MLGWYAESVSNDNEKIEPVVGLLVLGLVSPHADCENSSSTVFLEDELTGTLAEGRFLRIRRFLNSLVVEVSVVWTRGPSFVFRGRIPTRSNTAPTEKRTRETDGRIELRINPGVANANPRTKTHDCKEGLVHVGISSTTALVCRHLSQTTHVAPPNKYPDRRRVASAIHSSDWENGICTENALWVVSGTSKNTNWIASRRYPMCMTILVA